MVIGDPGTGKKTVVKEIHRKSKRKDHQIVFVNCSALSVATSVMDILLYRRGSASAEK